MRQPGTNFAEIELHDTRPRPRVKHSLSLSPQAAAAGLFGSFWNINLRLHTLSCSATYQHMLGAFMIAALTSQEHSAAAE